MSLLFVDTFMAPILFSLLWLNLMLLEAYTGAIAYSIASAYGQLFVDPTAGLRHICVVTAGVAEKPACMHRALPTPCGRCFCEKLCLICRYRVTSGRCVHCFASKRRCYWGNSGHMCKLNVCVRLVQAASLCKKGPFVVAADA